MKYLRYASILAVVAVAFAPVAHAQQDKDVNTPITKAGSAAFMFSMSGIENFGIQGPSGDGMTNGNVIAGAGMKYYFSDRLALRVGVSIVTSSSGPDSARLSTNNLGLGAGLEWHCHDLYAISPYLGANVGFRTWSVAAGTQFVLTTRKNGTVTPLATDPDKTSFTGFAGAVVAGFDWFVLRSIAIGSEYSIGFASVSSSTTSNGKVTDNPSQFLAGITGGGNVHLVVYF